ncbi:MAG: Spermine synthase [Gemmataceae bacterium]|nr:Spermine synthase [Gemmataceae bacterium]
MRDRPTFDLFVISWLILFLELACIRWFPSHVMFLTFFTNIVLLACFVGMSVGCLAARSPTRYLARTPYCLVFGLGVGVIIEQLRSRIQRYVAVGDQAKPEVVFFGTEASFTHDLPFRIPVEVVAGMFFVLIALILIGPGQEMGRAFARIPGRARAYSVNLLGSLAGIVSFAAGSYLELPPPVWFAAVAIGIVYLLSRPIVAPGTTVSAPPTGKGSSPPLAYVCLAVVVLLSVPTSGLVTLPNRPETTWSPYYRIDFFPSEQFINTNLVSHQVMEPREQPGVAYALPYLFQRDLTGADGKPAWPAFKRVLIIGAGSGNDVSRALQWLPADARIDAVEIDPVIQRTGALHHPDHPYQDKERVTVYLNDGRNFLRKAPAETYDLVIFALVDSLVLQSGYSNLRLESYLFTVESFRDVRRVLKPTGVYAVYNFFRQGWLAARIREELRSAFDTDPVVLNIPDARVETDPRDTIELELFAASEFTALFSGAPEVIDPLRAAFRGGNRYWYPWRAGVPLGTPAKFGTTPPPTPPDAPPGPPHHWADVGPLPSKWLPLRETVVEDSHGTLRPATDDWPFLYVREPSIPLVSWRGMGMMVVLSLGLAIVFRPRETGAGSAAAADYSLAARSFFLGAGFMLVETRAVVHMALLFGGTWMVNSVVFAAILLMSLAGNLFSAWLKPKRLQPYYLGLFAALGLGLAVPLDAFLGLERTAQVVGASALVFAPIVFAGVIFATSFARSVRPDRVFGANVAGALVGGLAENASVVLGFQHLLFVAAGFYLLSAVFGNRTPPTGAIERGA